MDIKIKEKIELYLRNQIAQPNDRVFSYIKDNEGNLLPERDVVKEIRKYIKEFEEGKDSRWIIIPGLRGIGKTTLLAQIYNSINCESKYKLFFSLDEAKSILQINLNDILTVYEDILESRFENLKKPVFLFIDEVQNEENWGAILKNLYDRSKNVFILCTGSSALSLQTNTDISRRSHFQKLYPLSFNEYMLIKYGKPINHELEKNIKEILFNSYNATELYNNLKNLEAKVTNYWIDIDRLEVDKFLKYGTLPFTLNIGEEQDIYSRIEQSLVNIEAKDIPQLGHFDNNTLSKINGILYAIASTDIAGLNTLGKTFEISEKTIRELLEILTKSELLLKILPYGSHLGQVKKPSKYLFLSSAYRNMFYNNIGSNLTYDKSKGKLLEDIVGLYLFKNLDMKLGTSINYDITEAGADFIIRLNDKIIIMEVGYGDKGFKQVQNTMKRIKSSYGISVSKANLILNDNKDSVLVPLKYFLLT